MKNSLFFVLFGVFLVLKNVEAEKCLPMPEYLIRNMDRCFARLTEDDQELYIEGEEPNKREFQCFHLCVVQKNGYFKDGEFDVEKMKEKVHKFMPTEELAEALMARNEESMLKAKEIGGDNCELAHEYMKIKMEKEKEDPLVTKIFCLDEVEAEEKEGEGEKEE